LQDAQRERKHEARVPVVQLGERALIAASGARKRVLICLTVLRRRRGPGSEHCQKHPH
jgi:hypothetical protein